MKQVEGWGGKSLKEHVEAAKKAADNAENIATELADRVVELQGQIAKIETDQAQRLTDKESISERWQAIELDIVSMAKIVEFLAANIAQTYDSDDLQALGCADNLINHIQQIGLGVEEGLRVAADDIRALADRVKGEVHHERG